MASETVDLVDSPLPSPRTYYKVNEIVTNKRLRAEDGALVWLCSGQAQLGSGSARVRLSSGQAQLGSGSARSVFTSRAQG